MRGGGGGRDRKKERSEGRWGGGGEEYNQKYRDRRHLNVRCQNNSDERSSRNQTEVVFVSNLSIGPSY